MSLLDIATKVMEGFDPATDKVDTFEEVADGTYTCLLEKVTDRANDKGTEWISVDFSIMDENDNRHIFVPYFFTEKTTERSIKALNKLAYDFGYELPVESFENLKTLAETLNNMAGNTANVTKTTGKNDFVTYKVEPTDMPF